MSTRNYVGLSEEELVGVGNKIETDSKNVRVGRDVHVEYCLPPYMELPTITYNDGTGAVVGEDHAHIYKTGTIGE